MKIKCDKCNREVSKNNFSKHYNSCKGKESIESQCCFCNKSWKELEYPNKANHIRWCVLNPKRSSYVEKLTTKSNIVLMNEKRKETGFSNQFSKPKLLNLEAPESKLKGREGTFKGKHHLDETKEKMRIKATEAIKNGRVIKAGRCKKIKYLSPLSGELNIDGSWELKFCKWCDSKNIKIQRSGLRFEYINLKGRVSLYHPDFKVGNLFIEIKGYETELDKCKWSQFPERLIVLREPQIKNLDYFSSLEEIIQYFSL